MSKKSNILLITTCAIFTALFCVFAPMSVPIGPIPVSLTNLIIYLSIYILKTKKSLISYVVYLLIGLVGLPVFSGYQGGPAKLFGPTGGYLVGFVFIHIIAGLIFEKYNGKYKIALTILGMIIGTAICYAFGTVWFIFQMDCELGYALSVCVFPFIPFDLGKIAIASLIGLPIRRALVAQNLID